MPDQLTSLVTPTGTPQGPGAAASTREPSRSGVAPVRNITTGGVADVYQRMMQRRERMKRGRPESEEVQQDVDAFTKQANCRNVQLSTSLPRSILKESQEIDMQSSAFQRGYLNKTAGKVWDAISGAPAGALLGGLAGGLGGQAASLTANAIGGAVGTAGSIAGVATNSPIEPPKEEKDTAGSMALGLIPGVGPYRQGRRLRETVDVSRERSGPKSRAMGNMLSEVFGPYTSAAVLGVAGVGIGGLAGAGFGKATGHDADEYAKAGRGMGAAAGIGVAGLAMVTAAVLALARKTRTTDEQVQRDETSNLGRNLLVPGTSAYDYFKRYGASENFRKDHAAGVAQQRQVSGKSKEEVDKINQHING